MRDLCALTMAQARAADAVTTAIGELLDAGLDVEVLVDATVVALVRASGPGGTAEFLLDPMGIGRRARDRFNN